MARFHYESTCPVCTTPCEAIEPANAAPERLLAEPAIVVCETCLTALLFSPGEDLMPLEPEDSLPQATRFIIGRLQQSLRGMGEDPN